MKKYLFLSEPEFFQNRNSKKNLKNFGIFRFFNWKSNFSLLKFKRENFDFQLKNFRFFSKIYFFNFFFPKCSNFFFRWTQKNWGSISILQITYFRFLALSERFGHSQKTGDKNASDPPPYLTEAQITVFSWNHRPTVGEPFALWSFSTEFQIQSCS